VTVDEMRKRGESERGWKGVHQEGVNQKGRGGERNIRMREKDEYGIFCTVAEAHGVNKGEAKSISRQAHQ